MTTVLDALNSSLHKVMVDDPRVYLIGQDVLDPYGGAFKVSRGLSDAFPRRVLTTPISEAGIVGLAGGMALRGLRPVVEIMFGDFLTLAADQIINGLTKFHWMYNEEVNVPLVIRTPMGGRRGYGPTHSQTLEKHFLGVPGLRVLAPCAFGDPGQLLADAIIKDDKPVLFIENKLLYLQKVNDTKALEDFDLAVNAIPGSYAPCYLFSLQGAPSPSLTLLTYGYMAGLALLAAHRLAYEHELFCELLVVTQLVNFERQPPLPEIMLSSMRQTRRMLTIEEGGYTMGWGAEMLARAKEALGSVLISARRVAAQDTPIPASIELENNTLPGVENIIQTALSMV